MRTVKLLNTDQTEVLDVSNQQIVIIIEGYNLESNVTTKRDGSLELNTSNKYMKSCNGRKVSRLVCCLRRLLSYIKMLIVNTLKAKPEREPK